MNDYFYWPPLRKKFFFPQSIPLGDLINDFYKPYKFKAKLAWKIFLKFDFIKKIFTVDESQVPVPFSLIKSILNKNNIEFSKFMINLGTPGIEQKTSIIVLDRFFNKMAVIKLSDKSFSKSLISKEKKCLSRLKTNNFKKPRIIDYEKKKDYNILVLEYLEGIKLESNICSQKIIDTVISIINSYEITRKGELLYTFAHGDYCPWNILINENNEIALIDWEMAGYYPLGYDLFNFIFQTQFLVTNKSSKLIFSSHKSMITKFFKIFNIDDWLPYLNEFCNIKLSKDNIKNQGPLASKYQKLQKLIQ